MANDDDKPKSRCTSAVAVPYVTRVCVLALTVLACTNLAWAQEAATRTIPSRTLPVELFGPAPGAPKIPKSAEELRVILNSKSPEQEAMGRKIAARVADMREKFGIAVVRQVIGGVPSYVLTPKVISPRNRNRLLVYLHGGGFVGEAAGPGITLEALEMAGLTGIKTIAVDYRGLPDHPFPAPMDDVMAVWKEIVQWTKPGNIAAFGTSAGGNLVLCLVQRAKREGLPLPGAVMSGTPVSDLSKTGDSYYINEGIDYLFVCGA